MANQIVGSSGAVQSTRCRRCAGMLIARARQQIDRFFSLEHQPRRSLQQQHPFVPVLVQPAAVGRSVTQRDDPLDEQIGRAEQAFGTIRRADRPGCQPADWSPWSWHHFLLVPCLSATVSASPASNKAAVDPHVLTGDPECAVAGQTTTAAFSWASRTAMLRPIPREAPVTLATFPRKGMDVLPSRKK